MWPEFEFSQCLYQLHDLGLILCGTLLFGETELIDQCYPVAVRAE